MLISLTVAILPWQTLAEIPSALPTNVPEQAMEPPRRGIVTLMANLRASPSTQSGEIVTVVKEGALVEILAESERWYRVRTDDGVEAWIGKRLVLLQREPLKEPRARPAAVVQPDIIENPVASAPKLDVIAESRSENTPEQQGLAASSAAPLEEHHVPPDMPEIGWFLDAILPHVQALGAYFIIALAIVLVLSIALQLRASRQLRRAMQEMAQIVDIVEEIYTGGTLVRTRDTVAAMNSMPPEVSARQGPRPVFEFSAIEHAVLEALTDQHEVQERELGKILDEKGFAGMLIKGIIGDIVRKTGAAGLPWVEVRYMLGQCSYRLRPEAVSNLSA
jgi:SH3-like domain-containing protein